MYVNQHIGNRLFAFLRKYGKELMLVVANFSDEEVETDVNIPRHAMEVMDIPEGDHTATDLLSDEKTAFCLQADSALHITVAPWYGRVYKIVRASRASKKSSNPASSEQ